MRKLIVCNCTVSKKMRKTVIRAEHCRCSVLHRGVKGIKSAHCCLFVYLFIFFMLIFLFFLFVNSSWWKLTCFKVWFWLRHKHKHNGNYSWAFHKFGNFLATFCILCNIFVSSNFSRSEQFVVSINSAKSEQLLVLK